MPLVNFVLSSPIPLPPAIEFSLPAVPSLPDLSTMLVIVPEPSTGLLMIVGLLGLVGWRRTRS